MRESVGWIKALEPFQVDDLVRVHEAAGAMLHHRELLRRAMIRARHGGLTVEQLAEVTGFTPGGVAVILRHEVLPFRGVHPIDPLSPASGNYWLHHDRLAVWMRSDECRALSAILSWFRTTLRGGSARATGA